MAEIRRALKSDLHAIQTCAMAAYSMYIDRIGREPAPMVADFSASIEREQLHVLEQETKVVGFVVFYVKQDHVHLENIAVDPGYQQCGFGTRLVEFAEQQARTDGYARIELYTNAKMTENLGLYPRLGYQQFDRRVEDGFDRLYFKKDL